MTYEEQKEIVRTHVCLDCGAGKVGVLDIGMTALGIVTQQEIAARSKKDPTRPASPVVAAHPQRMAEKRAEWQFLRKAVPLGIEEERDADDQTT